MISKKDIKLVVFSFGIAPVIGISFLHTNRDFNEVMTNIVLQPNLKYGYFKY